MQLPGRAQIARAACRGRLGSFDVPTRPSQPQEDQMTEQTKTRITGVRTVGVPVTDQGRALTFYVQTLAFEKRLDAPVEQLGGRWIEVAPAGAAITIARVPAPRAAGRRRDRHRQIRKEVARS